MTDSTSPRFIRVLSYAAGVSALLVFLAVYAPRVGHGFIADDFEWASRNRIASAADIGAIFTRDNGFYRPVIALSFAVNHYWAGKDPWLYGVTNLALALATAVAVAHLCRSLALPGGAAIFAAVLWLLNFHGINMAVLWLSGRTALIVALFATLAAAALVRHRIALATAFFAVAIFSKEEALLLPLIGAVWLFLFRDRRQAWRRATAWWIISTAGVTVLYLVARAMTDAMTVGTAPAYDRFTFSPAAVARNVLEYADRSMTFSVMILILAGLVLRNVPQPSSASTRRILWASATWMIGSFALTVFLPIRSSLYVCLPSVAAVVAVAALVSEIWRRAPERRRRTALLVATVLPIVLFPIYTARTVRWVSLADFSARVLDDLAVITRDLPEHSTVLLLGDRSDRANLDSAFGSILSEAVYFETGRRLRFWIEPPGPYAEIAGLERPCEGCAVAKAQVRSGRLESIRQVHCGDDR